MDILIVRPLMQGHAVLAKAGMRAFSMTMLALLCLCTAASGQTPAGGDAPPEYSVKGAYLFKFSGFVEWPPGAFPSPNAPFVIGVLGDDPFGGILERMMAGQSVEGRPVEVLRTHRIDQARSAHILFISQSELPRMDLIQSSLQNSSVLTVADFSRPGIIINFIMANNKVRFAVNLDQAQRAGLKLNSRLLSVAAAVHGKERQ